MHVAGLVACVRYGACLSSCQRHAAKHMAPELWHACKQHVERSRMHGVRHRTSHIYMHASMPAFHNGNHGSQAHTGGCVSLVDDGEICACTQSSNAPYFGGSFGIRPDAKMTTTCIRVHSTVVTPVCQPRYKYLAMVLHVYGVRSPLPFRVHITSRKNGAQLFVTNPIRLGHTMVFFRVLAPSPITPERGITCYCIFV